MRLKLSIIDERRGRILAHRKLVAHLLDPRCRALRAASSRASWRLPVADLFRLVPCGVLHALTAAQCPVVAG